MHTTRQNNAFEMSGSARNEKWKVELITDLTLEQKAQAQRLHTFCFRFHFVRMHLLDRKRTKSSRQMNM